MKKAVRLYLLAFAVLALALGLAACGGDDDDDGGSDGGGSGAQLIQENPENEGVRLTIGSKNFTEQIVLGEIYAQALEAAGYQVGTDLNLGSETVALQALRSGEISGYPEYASTALTSFFDTPPEDVPGDARQAYEMAKADFEKDGLTAFPPTPFASANAVGLLKTKADELGVKNISDLQGKDTDLMLYGSPECRQRTDCLLGLQRYYGLNPKFTPVDIGLRYEVLDKGQADLSILFTTDAQLADSDEYVLLEDDKDVLPAGNVMFVTDRKTVQQAGPDYQATIEEVQSGLTERVMQELDARVDLDKETPEQVAGDYLKEAGYTE